MFMTPRALIGLSCTLAFAGCSITAPAVTPPSNSTSNRPPSVRKSASPRIVNSPAPATTQPAVLTTLDGQIRVPAGLITEYGAKIVSNGGAGVIANNGGGLIANNGGGLIANNGGGYKLQQLESLPAPGVEVMVTDLKGKPLADIPVVKTDDAGNFRFPQVPTKQDLLVIARPTDKDAKPLLLQALTYAKVGGSRVDVTIASSLVASSVLAGELPGKVNHVAVEKATAAVEKNLTRETIPDMTNQAAIFATVDQFAKDVAEIRGALDDVRSEALALDGRVPLGWTWFMVKAGTASYYEEDGQWVAALKPAVSADTNPYGLKRTIKGDFTLELEATAEVPKDHSVYLRFGALNAEKRQFGVGRTSSNRVPEKGDITRTFGFLNNPFAPALPSVATEDTDTPDQFSMKVQRLNKVLRAFYRDGWTGDYIKLGSDVAVDLPEEAEFSISFVFSIANTPASGTVRFRTIRLTQ